MIPLGILAAAGAGGGSAGNAMELISTQILGSTAASVTFSSIPSTFRHLQVRLTARDTSAGGSAVVLYMTFNGDVANSYNRHRLYGNGTSVISMNAGSDQNLWIGESIGSDGATGNFGASITDVLDYAQTTKYKTIRSFGGVTGFNEVNIISGAWRNTAAISTLRIAAGLSTFAVGSRFSLYGILG
jgi:Na+-transporting NADH:ubiquinone oxidoreductase subunit NqrB